MIPRYLILLFALSSLAINAQENHQKPDLDFQVSKTRPKPSISASRACEVASQYCASNLDLPKSFDLVEVIFMGFPNTLTIIGEGKIPQNNTWFWTVRFRSRTSDHTVSLTVGKRGQIVGAPTWQLPTNGEQEAAGQSAAAE